jgi:23S rRNA (adenine2503-C2)-methyltransferase
MDNLDAVLDVCRVLTSDWGLGWSPKRITVSSVGIIPGLKRFLDESQCHLAISLHNPVPQERLSIMPVQKAFPLNEVLALLRHYDWSGQRRLSFEYIVFGGLNDTITHAKEILRLLRGLECRINLIRFHHIPGSDLREASEERMEQLRDYLTQHGIFTTIRASRGQDIFAACGLLSTAKKIATERGQA